MHRWAGWRKNPYPFGIVIAMARFARFLVLFQVLLAFGCSRTAVLSDPPPASFFPMDTRSVEHGIVGGMARLKWMPAREGPGVIRGTLNLRTHTVVLRIEYTTENYSIRYVDSQNMAFAVRSDGTRMIHKNYNSWVRNLQREINKRLVPPAPGANDVSEF